MMPAPVRLVTYVMLASLVSSAAFAQTVVATAAKWDLLGSWRLDCTAPVSRSNAALSYVVRGGKLFHDRDFGGESKSDSSPVTAATIKPDGTLEITIPFASISATRQFAFVRASDGRIRALYNRNVDTDEYSIKDGKFTANGNTTPWQTRCQKFTN